MVDFVSLKYLEWSFRSSKWSSGTVFTFTRSKWFLSQAYCRWFELDLAYKWTQKKIQRRLWKMETQFIVCDFRFDHFFKPIFDWFFLAFSVLNLIYFHRLAEALHLFLLLWFYCTLTVRESILVVNGSRIRGWWVMHHYISAFLVGVHIIWPTASDGYDRFRNLTVWFSLLVSLVQVNWF